MLHTLCVVLFAAGASGLNFAALRRKAETGHGDPIRQPGSMDRHSSSERRSEESSGPVRMAVLMAGTSDRVLVKPLINNVVGANAKPGLAIDFFLSLRAPMMNVAKEYAADKNESKWLKNEITDRYTMDPAVSQYFKRRSSDQDDFNYVMATERLLADICDFAKKSNAASCYHQLEVDEPLDLPMDEAHHRVMTYYNPLETSAGKAVLAKWRSLELLWQRAKHVEKQQGPYSIVVVARDDDYWIAPYSVVPEDFVKTPTLTKVIPCLASHGINDKAVIMGRQSGEALLTSYKDWSGQIQDEMLGTRNAEEFWFKKAMVNGLTLVPSSMPMAVASFTTAGIPCFRKQTFDLSTAGGYEQCYGEEKRRHPLTKFFHELNCDELKPAYFDALPTKKVRELHDVLAKLAERSPSIVLTLMNATEADLAVNMLSSLAASGETSPCLIVGTQPGTCKALDILQVGVRNPHKHECVEVPHMRSLENLTVPFSAVERQIFRHAVLTTVIVSGLLQDVLYAAADVVFLKPPMQHFKTSYPNSHMVVVARNALEAKPESCTDVADMYKVNEVPDRLRIAGDDRRSDLVRVDIDNGLFFVQSAPGVADILLRSWMYLVDGEYTDTNVHRRALHRAIEDAPWVNINQAKCSHFVNGNMFWGHSKIVDPSKVVAVHANWVDHRVKRDCLRSSGLWGGDFSHWWEAHTSSNTTVKMGGSEYFEVVGCSSSLASAEEAWLQERADAGRLQAVSEALAAAQWEAEEELRRVDAEFAAAKAAKEADIAEAKRKERIKAQIEEFPPWWNSNGQWTSAADWRLSAAGRNSPPPPQELLMKKRT